MNPDAARHLPGLGSSQPFFLASSRFLKRKNLDGLVRAYRQYREYVTADHDCSADPWRLVILGDGEERYRLETLIQSFGVKDITIAGFRQIDELPCYFTELTLTPQFTYTVESMGIKMQYLSQNELDITCTNETSGSGTWERISPAVVKIGSENFALQGNKLISEREAEFPEFSKLVYVKVN